MTASHGAMNMPERKLPPIHEVAVLTMILVIIGGIWIAAHLPREVDLTFPFVLVIVAGALLIANVFMLSRIRKFAWSTFFLVVKWAAASYAVIAGLLGYTFIRNDTPGDVMIFLALMLIIYAVNIPMLFGFSVARYQDSDPS